MTDTQLTCSSRIRCPCVIACVSPVLYLLSHSYTAEGKLQLLILLPPSSLAGITSVPSHPILWGPPPPPRSRVSCTLGILPSHSPELLISMFVFFLYQLDNIKTPLFHIVFNVFLSFKHSVCHLELGDNEKHTTIKSYLALLRRINLPLSH